jgi:hypothetical protein
MNERDNYTLSFVIEFEWRVSYFKFSFFVHNYSQMYIQTGTTTLREYTNHTSVTKVKWIGHSRDITFWVSASFVNTYIYIYIDFESLYEVKYKLEWTMEKQRERERDKSGWINEKQIWWSWSFILLLSEAHSYSDKVIQMKKKK